MRRTLDPKSIALRCAELADQKKASEIVILDVKNIFPLSSYFVICSGESDLQVRAIASNIEEVNHVPLEWKDRQKQL